jgi:serine/threonine protein phosphatase 1
MSWLKTLFQPKSDANIGLAMSVAQPCYAIGDVHGRLDLFQHMISRIRQDWVQTGLPERPVLYFLGDLVDRGPHSRGVVDAFLALQGEAWCEARVLMGNHEEAMLQFMADPEFGPTWVSYGGAQTLASYGVPPPPVGSAPEVWAEVAHAFARAVPDAHKALLRSAPDLLRNGDFVFVHAGVRPGIALEAQSPSDCRWIRREFLAHEKACDAVVVHGHTPAEAVENRPWRIGLDTGAYATGVLSAVRLIGNRRDILNVSLQ